MKKNLIWDYVIVGTGMGGGPIGLKLAQAGHSVLFIERGRSPANATSIKGNYAELISKPQISLEEKLKRAGRFTGVLLDKTNKKNKKIKPFIGTGIGGSSALYGAVLERFKASDFEKWPLSMNEFVPHYQNAENLFQVKKNRKLLHPGNKNLSRYLEKQGLKPYTLPLAQEDHNRCGNCQSFLCDKNCKNDSYKMCIRPALEKYNATLIDECEVTQIQTQGRRATGVHIFKNGENNFIQAHNVIVAAGALSTPLLLKDSKNEYFSKGIGNHNDLVGRNLMRHYVDLYALKIDSAPQNSQAKELGLNDFYTHQGQTFGTVQSFGRLPPEQVVMDQLEFQAHQKHLLFGFALVLLRPLFRVFLHRLFAGRIVMASILEDAPHLHNRVWKENDEVCISYQISEEDQDKIRWMRKKLKMLFNPLGLFFIAKSEHNDMLAHACGTCRMGQSPENSVVDLENRIHGTENIYVVDSSFFPTSGGTNPALTIAANSLRVAELLLKQPKYKKLRQNKSEPITPDAL